MCSGALPWMAAHERRVALFRFAPATVAYGRSNLSSSASSSSSASAAMWPAEMTDGMTEEELAVMQPPFAERLDRPILSRSIYSKQEEGPDGADGGQEDSSSTCSVEY